MIIELLNINDIDIETLKSGVSKERLERASRYKSEADYLRSLSVEYLLNQIIKKNHPNVPTPVVLFYDANGKPHLKDKNGVETLFISLSHSGDYVACMIDTVPCGIDLELQKEKSYKRIVTRICSDTEAAMINTLTDFYNIWTLKEAILKATGKGLSLDMRSFEIQRISGHYETCANSKKYIGQVISDINSYPEGYSLSYMRLNS